MKILALSNFYPPHHIGGEELSAQSIVNGLRQRGHCVEVITSNYGSVNNESHVHREFFLEMEFVPFKGALHFFTKRETIINANKQILRKHVDNYHPDVVLIFSMWNLPREIPALAENLLGDRVVYRLASYWPLLPSQYVQYWNAPAKARVFRNIKKILRSIALSILNKKSAPHLGLKHTICISQKVQDEFERKGVFLPDNTIIHNGINVNRFVNKETSWGNGTNNVPKKLLYVGRISPEKGLETAIESMVILQQAYPELTLSVIGAAKDDQEFNKLKSYVKKERLSEKVDFLGPVSYCEIPELMWNHHILIVPSIWQEPFGRVVLEGMAAGMVVIGTGQGGMSVILKNQITGLTFPPKDAQKLSNQIERVLANPTLGNKLSETAQNIVMSEFTEKIMVDAYENQLIRILSRFSNNDP
jgi:glycosyltransferase involved in cell wall biosynthesis